MNDKFLNRERVGIIMDFSWSARCIAHVQTMRKNQTQARAALSELSEFKDRERCEHCENPENCDDCEPKFVGVLSTYVRNARSFGLNEFHLRVGKFCERAVETLLPRLEVSSVLVAVGLRFIWVVGCYGPENKVQTSIDMAVAEIGYYRPGRAECGEVSQNLVWDAKHFVPSDCELFCQEFGKYWHQKGFEVGIAPRRAGPGNSSVFYVTSHPIYADIPDWKNGVRMALYIRVPDVQ